MSEDLFIAGIGASAGGQDAIRSFFRYVPSGLPVAYAIVTHLTRDFRTELPNIISRFTDLPVIRVNGVMRPKANCIYVMPEDAVLLIEDGLLFIKPRDERRVNDAIDTFFESLALDQQERAIGIVLSGMGNDGAMGVRKIHEHGGTVLVQEPQSAEFTMMPQSAVREDHPELVLKPEQLGMQLEKIIENKRLEIHGRRA